jgi:hypothetical protein
MVTRSLGTSPPPATSWLWTGSNRMLASAEWTDDSECFANTSQRVLSMNVEHFSTTAAVAFIRKTHIRPVDLGQHIKAIL